MTRRPRTELRRGWTTGTCATAATRAAYEALLTGVFPDPVAIRLPGGQTPSFALACEELRPEAACAGVIKDAGDDPDVTHGALVLARVQHGVPGTGVVFRAGPGVGTVSRPGLVLAVGEPAINPGPRTMMTRAIREVANTHGATGDVSIEISIPEGLELARRTLNGRLGIVGGLSVLGTTGVVVPFSCAAWIDSIHRGIDVARAAGVLHVAAATGSTSEAAVRRQYDLPEIALLDMGDFAGAVLKYLRRRPIPRLTLAGGFGKLSKLAAGALDLHSRRSQVDLPFLADEVRRLGGSARLVARMETAVSAGQALALAGEESLALADAVANRARTFAQRVVGDAVTTDVLIFDATGTLLGAAPR